MQIVLLVGGLGTRLGKITKKMPKPMIKINKKPFLQYQLESFKKTKMIDYVFCVGYLSEQIIRYFGDGSRYGVNIRYSVEKEQLGTGGAIKNSLPMLEKNFIVSNGDTYIELDVNDLLKFHKRNKSDITIAVIKIHDTSRYGNVIINNKRIIDFKNNVNGSYGFISAGVYVIRKDSINWKNLPNKFSIEKDVFPKLVKKKRVYAYDYNGKFIDIGIPESLKQFRSFAKSLDDN